MARQKKFFISLFYATNPIAVANILCLLSAIMEKNVKTLPAGLKKKALFLIISFFCQP